MYPRKRLVSLCITLLSLPLAAAAPAEVGLEACAPFYQALDAVPHESIFQRGGPYTSTWFGIGAIGCTVVMVTSEKRLGERQLPDLTAAPGTPLHQTGWRINRKYIADGPGSGVVGVEKDDLLCLVYTEQPAWIDDAGRHLQSKQITVTVECMAGEGAKGPRYQLQKSPQQ
jgi:hypothetical protein